MKTEETRKREKKRKMKREREREKARKKQSIAIEKQLIDQQIFFDNENPFTGNFLSQSLPAVGLVFALSI